MSYIRAVSVYRFVDGTSRDYIFPSYKKVKSKTKYYIEDYGKISNETLVELVARYGLFQDEEFGFKDYIIKKLAERLNVKLRKKPLNIDEEIETMWTNHQKFLQSDIYKAMKFDKGCEDFHKEWNTTLGKSVKWSKKK